MTSRERVVTALSRKEPDRVPVDVGSTHNSSIHIDAYRNLAEYLGIEDKNPRFVDIIQQAVTPGEGVLQRLGVDTRLVPRSSPKGWTLTLHEEEDHHWFVDEWGVTWRKPKHGYYFDMVEHPLTDATIKDLDDYPWPDPLDPGRYEGVGNAAKHLYEDTEFAVVGDPGAGSLFERNWYLTGIEKFLMDMLTNHEFVEKLLAVTLEISEKKICKFLDVAGAYIQVLALNGDLAMQTGPLMSPDLYRRVIKPYHKRLHKLVKSRTDAKIFRHCCGNITAFLPDFIEYGIDAMHPVQVSATDMDTKKLKQRFGDKMGFWGGIDTQHVLPHGSVEDVKAEVKRRIDDLGPGGGYVLAAVHNIQRDVPPENIVAMFDTAREYGQYPL